MNLKSLFKPNAELVEVQFLETCLVANQTYESGMVTKFPEKTAKELVAAGRAIDIAQDAEKQKEVERLRSLIPGPIEPLPVPSNWADLPECFTRWHELNSKYQALVKRAAAIEEMLIATCQRNRVQLDLDSIRRNAGNHASKLIEAVIANIEVGMPDLRRENEIRTLTDALQRANQAVEDWLGSNREKTVYQKILCGDEAVAAHGELCREIRELESTALAIFSERIKPLGLAESKIRELFRGSADCVRYQVDKPSLDDLCVGWAEEKGARLILDKPCETIASLVESFRQQLDAVRGLFADARKELARTSKASAKAAA